MVLKRTAAEREETGMSTSRVVHNGAATRFPRGLLATVTILLLTAATCGGEAPNARPDGIFADVGGWIAYGNRDGIWAVDPGQPGDSDDQVQLSSKQGIPRAWSPDGSKLLVVGAPNSESEGGRNRDTPRSCQIRKRRCLHA